VSIATTIPSSDIMASNIEGSTPFSQIGGGQHRSPGTNLFINKMYYLKLDGLEI